MKYKYGLLLIGLNILCYTILHYFTSDDFKVNARQLIFSKIIKSPKVFEAPPDSLGSYGFKEYKNDFLSFFKEKNKSELAQNHFIIADSIPTTETIKKIVLSFSKNGGKGCGDYSDDLMQNIIWSKYGGGCCSDHAQVFTALCLLNGLYTREVHNKIHTFNEVWDIELKKWIWVDPQFCLLGMDNKGNYLSLLEIQNRITNKKKINWQFFGNRNHIFYNTSPISHQYYQPKIFSEITITMGNRVFSEDIWNEKLKFLPKDLRQLIMISTGISPTYYIYSVSSKFKNQFLFGKILILISIFFYTSTNLYLIYKTLLEIKHNN
jgi:hypothetical protein